MPSNGEGIQSQASMIVIEDETVSSQDRPFFIKRNFNHSFSSKQLREELKYQNTLPHYGHSSSLNRL
jgi:hypothetical protein